MDDYHLFYNLIILGGLLLLSAIFSGAEVAFFSIDNQKAKKIEKNLIGKYILELIEFPKRLLVTILVGNTIFNVTITIISVLISIDIAKSINISVDLAITVQIVVITILILLIGEITPKVLASKNPIKYAKVVAIPLYWSNVILYPISKVFSDLISVVAQKIPFKKNKTALSSTEISELTEIGLENGKIEENEHEIIQGLADFKSVTAREVMTPRVDMTAISTDSEFNEIIKIVTESGHSRIPLYKNDLDNIIGIVYAKDLLPFISSEDSKKNFSLKKIARQAMFVPESKLINELLQEFKAKNMHLGIVVDEYGGTAGLISLEDILEEIVGEIRDEYDKEENEITKISDYEYSLLGKADIDELFELLNIEKPDDDEYDTVGGFIFSQCGQIPEEGFSFVFEQKFKFIVKEVENNRINKVLLLIIDPQENNS